MKKPGIGISINEVIEHIDEKEVNTGIKNISIEGNKEGLLKLAEIITTAALSNQRGYHIHLDSTDKPSVVKGGEFQLTIGLNSTK